MGSGMPVKRCGGGRGRFGEPRDAATVPPKKRWITFYRRHDHMIDRTGCEP